MPSQHANPLLGWHPPAELSAWARAEAQRRGISLSVVLTEALAAYRDSMRQRDDVFAPGPEIRDAAGVITGCKGLRSVASYAGDNSTTAP
jgi:hypothetical protein